MLDLKLDERAALKIVEVALKKVSEVRRDRDHELRARFDAFVRRFIEKLKTDPATREKLHRMRDEALDNPALAGYVGSLWEEFRAWLAAAACAAAPAATRWSSARREARRRPARSGSGSTSRSWRALPALVEEHRAKFGRFIEDQILGWQEEKLVAELERHIGPDLQYIRINGTRGRRPRRACDRRADAAPAISRAD